MIKINEVSTKGKIREMDIDELLDLLKTVKDEKILNYIREQIRQMLGNQ